MNEHVENLRAAVRATTLHSPSSFSWFGRRNDPPPLRVRRAIAGDERFSYLIALIRARLYSDFYCRGAPTRPSLSTGILAGRWTTDFVRALSTANVGSGCWDDGWRSVGQDGDRVVMEKRGLHLRVACASEASTATAVRMPKELRHFSPGFYFALGDSPITVRDASDVLRLYWHLTAEGAAPFVRAMTAGLNAAGVGFRVKVLSDPSAFVRCDAGVLYLSRADWPSVRESVAAARRRLDPFMRPATPALTKRLAPGLGLAEDPGHGTSYGLQRCEMIAEGLVEAFRRPRRTIDARIAVIMERLIEAGVRPEAPYLNPGSEDIYVLEGA